MHLAQDLNNNLNSKNMALEGLPLASLQPRQNCATLADQRPVLQHRKQDYHKSMPLEQARVQEHPQIYPQTRELELVAGWFEELGKGRGLALEWAQDWEPVPAL